MWGGRRGQESIPKRERPWASHICGELQGRWDRRCVLLRGRARRNDTLGRSRRCVAGTRFERGCVPWRFPVARSEGADRYAATASGWSRRNLLRSSQVFSCAGQPIHLMLSWRCPLLSSRCAWIASNSWKVAVGVTTSGGGRWKEARSGSVGAV